VDRDYLNTVRRDKNSVHLISLDNQWEGSTRQWLGCIWSRWALLPFFEYCWVPGEPQAVFARRLGFPEHHILRGFYAADTEAFSEVYSKRKATDTRAFIYTGRYVAHKGILDLWAAFDQYRKEGGRLELFALGTGDQWERRPQIEGLHHTGFVQPAEMEPWLLKNGVFVLPSLFEPWGVVVHEMAAAGFPMLLSDKVGASTAYLREGENGFLFAPGDRPALTALMHRMEHIPDSEFRAMGARSLALAQDNSPKIWAEKILSFKE
jgi:glycosyltransferase involved in cell wall biosynthesis